MSATDRIKELTRPTGEEDLLPVQYPSPRFHVEPKQALAASAVALAFVGGWAGWSLTHASDATGNAASWDTVATESHAPEQVVVSVVGEVANPGLVTLNQGARVADALNIAQPHPHADLIALNHAQLLVGGQQIHVTAIGEAAPVAAPPGSPGGTGLISINSASATELTALPGIGDATAAAIVAHREVNGPFTTLEALMDVKGIGPAKFEALKDQVAL